MRKNFKNQPLPSLIIEPSDDQNYEWGSDEMYDEQPTIMLLKSNRNSLNSMNKRYGESSLNNRNVSGKIKTYESDLMQSSPQKSSSSGAGGEFFCKYLTPIKKQQSDKLLFKDQINENLQNKRQAKIKYQQYKKTQKIKNPQISFNQKSNQPIHLQKTSHRDHNMIQSFMPAAFHEETNFINGNIQNYSAKNQCRCKLLSENNQSHKGIFMNPQYLINFLKSNNQKLFQKLTIEMQKKAQLQSIIQSLRKQNQNNKEINEMNKLKIKQLDKIIRKYQVQKKEMLAKQWEQFNMVKQYLIQKKRSKSTPFLSKIVAKQNLKQSLNKCLQQIQVMNPQNVGKTYDKQIQDKQKVEIIEKKSSKKSFSMSSSPLVNIKTMDSEQNVCIEGKKRKTLPKDNINSLKKNNQNKQNYGVQKLLLRKLMMDAEKNKKDNKPSNCQQIHQINGSKKRINRQRKASVLTTKRS